MRAPELPATHHVVACLGGDRVRIEERPVPVPGPGEALLRLRAVGLCGTDLFKLDTGAAAPGTVLGHELVGEVAALGAAVDGFRVGERVAVPHHVACGTCDLCRRGSETMCATFRENLLEPGGFADHVLVRPRALAQAARRLPDSLSDEAAVFMEPAACVLRGVQRSGLAAGGSAVVLGAGSMGLLHLLVLRARDPRCRVLVVDPIAARRQLASDLGASATAAPEAVSEPGAAPSPEVPADAVFDTVGGAAMLDAALALTRHGGTAVLFAHAGDGDRAGFDLNRFFRHERRIVATYSGGLAEQAEIFEMLRAGRLDPTPLATHRLPLDEFGRGVALTRRREALKVLFTPSRAGARA